jgi:c-di-GMP-binding flagellar brake protein YcgR
MSLPPTVSAERRRARRVRIALQAKVRLLDQPDRPPLLTHSVDLSTGGMLLACVGISGRVQISVQLPDRGGRLDVTANVVRTEPGRTGVEFYALDARQRQTIARLAPAVGAAA